MSTAAARKPSTRRDSPPLGPRGDAEELEELDVDEEALLSEEPPEPVLLAVWLSRWNICRPAGSVK